MLKTKVSDLKRSLLADPLIELVFQKRGRCDLFLVGGNLRDIFLGRRSSDRDFVVDGDPAPLATAIAAKASGKVVVLGGRRIHRVVLPDRSTLDFSRLKNDIEGNLRRRDFTINSLGWSPSRGLMDPNDALRDLGGGVIRMIGRDNLKNDPVRIVRAYRFSAELGFCIERETRKALKALSPFVEAAKAERITLEFFRILNINDSCDILKTMLDDAVLERIILLSYSELQSGLKVISSFQQKLDVLPLMYKINLSHRFSQNLSYSGLLGLESLLQPGSQAHLALSSRVRRQLRKFEEGDAFRRGAENKGLILAEISFELFELLADAATDYLVVTGRHDLLQLYEKFRQIMEKGLLSTDEIKEFCGLAEGELLGRTIRAVRKAQFYNKISDKETAREFLGGKEARM